MPDKKKEASSVATPTNSTATSAVKPERVGIKRRHTEDGQSAPDGLNYDPMHFIRSHSKNNDPADVQTQIWEVVFEPDPLDTSKTTTKIATCGGNSICIIDVNTGTVLMKYKHKELKENFYTLAWTTLQLASDEDPTNILVSGGIRGEIRMFHPAHKVCFHEWRPVDKKTIAVNSLAFHSHMPTWLFCGTSDGHVALWDIGTPQLPQYDGVNPVELLRLFPDYGDVYNIAFSGGIDGWLLAGTAAGLVGWKIDVEAVKKNKKETNPQMVDFIMPESPRDKGENPIVDSLAVCSTTTIVSKCALHGLIYVWDLAATVDKVNAQTPEEDANVIEQEVVLLANLKWSDTDNFYMNLGCHKGKGLIVCGDDKGSLWLYNHPQFGLETTKADVKEFKNVVEPSTRLIWPELQDDHLENSRKVPIDRHNIIVDKVATSHDGNHIVAVTNNNMVCIWKRSSDEDSSSAAASE